MPRLPSGRHVAVSGRRFAADGLTWEDLGDVHCVDDLAPYISIDLYREVTPFDQHRLAEQPPLAAQSTQPPADQIGYDSGYTLANVEELMAQWSDEDADALREFINGKRFQAYLHDTLRQILLATEQVEPRIADVLKFHPPTRELFERDED